MIDLFPIVLEEIAKDLIRHALRGEHVAIGFNVQPGFAHARGKIILLGFERDRVLCGIGDRQIERQRDVQIGGFLHQSIQFGSQRHVRKADRNAFYIQFGKLFECGIDILRDLFVDRDVHRNEQIFWHDGFKRLP